MSSATRLAVAAALVAVATLATATPAAAAATADLGQCTTTRGTIVAVDFGHWAGPVVRGCGVQADGQPDASGYVLLHDGGFTSAGTNRGGPAFICRLGSGSFAGGTQYPTPAQDACNVTPPQSAYWSLWLAPPGASSWQYSDYGATSDRPVAGEVELWSFGGTNAGGTSGSGVPASSLIDQLRAHNTSTPASTPATTQLPAPPMPTPPGNGSGTTTAGSTGHGAATGPRTGAISSAATTTGHDTSVSGPVDASPTAPGATDPAATGGAPGGGPAIVAAQPTSTRQHGSGSVLPLVITVVILAALGGLGGLTVLRRRRAGE